MSIVAPEQHRFVFLLLVLSLMFAFTSSFKASSIAEDKGEISSNDRTAAVNEQDSLALVALYHSTGGQEWTNNTNWLKEPVDTWFGITVADGRVIRLELAGNNLKDYTNSGSIAGTIPPEVGDLSQLQVLDLHANRIQGTIPVEIANLLQLQVLDLQSNHLRGAVPAEITRLTNLLHLHLKDNDLEDLPDLGVVGTLATLSVENNRLTFEDIEPNVGLAFTFTYAPQALVDDGNQAQAFYEGGSVAMHLPVGGKHNRYQWYKDGVALAGAIGDRHTMVNMTALDEGDYELEITNTLATDLTLRSRPIRLSFINAQWLDIGAYHHAYDESGARHEVSPEPAGMEYPAILRHSGHIRAKAFWIGVKDWTDPQGQHYPYYVARIGPRGSGVPFPIQNKLIGRYEDTVVEVNGTHSFGNRAILDEIDPGIAADRMIHNIHNMSVGITTDRKVYAYTNAYHDNYHIIAYDYCNTGNTDGDAEIELPNQTLHDVYFFRIHRWRGSEQAAWAMSGAQVWGRYTVHDVVGDGHQDYPVDFTAQYAWYGFDLLASYEAGYSNLGSALFTDHLSVEDNEAYRNLVADGDSVGRLAGPTMIGRSTIHADHSTTDTSYDRDQPTVISWIDNDEPLTSDGASHEEYYELGILTRENPARNPGCATCFTRAYPHFVDRRQPNGEFWDPSGSDLPAGGISPTTGYGPYEMASGECVNIVVSEGIAGLSFDAATKIGRAYKRGGSDRDTDLVAYDANGDGVINMTPFDYDNIFVGTEAQAKNQWVLIGGL